VIVETLDATGEDGYDAFLRSRPEALVYYSRSYRDLLVELLGCDDRSLVAREDGEVRGVMPLLHRSGVFNSLPYYGSNGGVLASDATAAAALVKEYDALATAPDTVSATVVSNPFGGAGPSPVHNLVDERIAHFTSLADDPLARIEPSARRNVRRAESAGIVVRADPDALSRLYELHDENIRALGGRPKSRAFFDLIARRLVVGDEWQVFAAYRGGEMVAGLLLLYFERTVEYFTPAIDHRYRADQPLAAILSTAMEDAAARGLERWNWGGTWSSQESLRRFKVKWGAEESRYGYFVQLNRPELLDSTPAALYERYGDFFVLPYSALRSG
jgi:hypothetical protein